MSRRHIGTWYFKKVLDQSTYALTGPLDRCLYGVEYDTIVGTGMSGVIAVARLAPALGKNALYVRKPDDNSCHSSSRVEGYMGERILFVDDMISTGTTLMNVMRTLSRECDREGIERPTLAGFYSYERLVFQPVEDIIATCYGIDPTDEEMLRSYE